jgi:hypothetical protein
MGLLRPVRVPGRDGEADRCFFFANRRRSLLWERDEDTEFSHKTFKFVSPLAAITTDAE